MRIDIYRQAETLLDIVVKSVTSVPEPGIKAMIAGVQAMCTYSFFWCHAVEDDAEIAAIKRRMLQKWPTIRLDDEPWLESDGFSLDSEVA